MARIVCTDEFKETTLAQAMDRGVVSDKSYIEGVLDVLVVRDRHNLHRKLEALTNPPRNLAPPGKTTKL